MVDFFMDHKLTAAHDLKMLSIKDYRDIHLATLQVLEKTGIFVEDQQALEIFGSYGASVDKKNRIVKLPASIVENAISSAPGQVMLAGRNPERDILLEDNRNAFANSSSNINVVDPYMGIVRKSTKKDLVAATRLCDALKEVSIYSRAVYPLNRPSKVLHLHTAEACFNNTTKHCFHGPENEWEMIKIIEMAEVAIGGAENLKKRKPLTFIASISSPLKLTKKFCEVVMTSARLGFSTGLASMVMAGGTGPVNLAGVLVQTNAEILVGIVLTQLIQKGAPVIYASYSTGMDLRLGTSPLGSPEASLIASSIAGLCQYYQLPCLVPGILSDSKQHGAQAAFEKTLTGVSAAMSGANLISGIGGLETGLTFDFGLAVLDDEIVRMIKQFKSGIEVNQETLSKDIIHEIGPFGNFLSHDSTLLKMRSMSQTCLFDRSNREDWENKGKPRSYAKALSRAIEIIENHRPESLPESAIRRIRSIVEEAEKEVGLK